MKAKDHAVFEEEKRNFHQPLNEDDQTTPQESSIDECPQNGGLFSRETDARQTMGTLSPLDLSKFPDGTRVLQVGPPLIIDIPDSYIEAARNSREGADRQLPCNNVEKDLMTYRKVQSGYLIGKSMTSDISFPQTIEDRILLPRDFR